MVDGLAMIIPLIAPSLTDRDVPEHITLVRDEELLASLSPAGREEVENYYVVQSRQIWERTEAEVGVGVAAGWSAGMVKWFIMKVLSENGHKSC